MSLNWPVTRLLDLTRRYDGTESQTTAKRHTMATQRMRKTTSISSSTSPRFDDCPLAPSSTTKSIVIRQSQEDDYEVLYGHWETRPVLENPDVFFVTSRDLWDIPWTSPNIGRLYPNNEDTTFLSREEDLEHKYSGPDWIILERCKDGDSVHITSNVKIGIDPVGNSTTPLLLHQKEKKKVSAEFCCLYQFTQELSVKNSRRELRERVFHERSKQQVVQTTIIPEEPLDGSGDDNDGISIHDNFGCRAIARWKYSGGKGKEWRKRPWRSGSPVFQGVPETFLKRFPSSKNATGLGGRKPSKGKLEHSLLKSVTVELLTDLTNVCDQHSPYEEEKPTWPPERSSMPAHAIARGHASGELDKNRTSEDQTSLVLPNENYSGAIIGDRFQLGTVIEEHESPGERTYAVNDLMAPKMKLVARMYSLEELSGKYRDARKRHMKRLIRRENVCDIQQDEKRFIVYPCDTFPYPSETKQHTAQNQTQQGMRRPESLKEFQCVTSFPPLSSCESQIKSNAFWETSEVQRLFQKARKQDPLGPRAVTPSATTNDHEPPLSSQIYMPKRKRHRWKKSRKKDQAEVALLQPKTVHPSFTSCIEIDKYLELNRKTIMNIAVKIGLFEHANFEMSLSNDSEDPSIQRAFVFEILADQKRWLIDQLDYVRTLLGILSQYYHVQDRRGKIVHLAQEEKRLSKQQAEDRPLARKLQEQLMKSKDVKATERLKNIHTHVCEGLDNISVALEDTIRRKEAELAGGGLSWV